MNHYNLSELKPFINKRGFLAKTVVSHKHITIRNIMLDSFESIPPHEATVDVTFIILEGSGEITIGNETYQVKKDDIVLCKPFTLMSIRANKEEKMSFLNIKTPGVD
jgi:quercetin dioxygenase-like cupin family protein